MSWGERSEARLLYLCMSKVGKEIRQRSFIGEALNVKTVLSK